MTNEEVRENARMWLSAHLDSDDDIKTPWGQRGLQNLIDALLHAYNAGVEDAARASWDAIHELDPSGRFHDAQEVANTAIRDLKLCEGEDDGTNGC
jgi:hypothetical protein